MPLTTDRIRHLSTFYRQVLLEDVVPFWCRHAIDREYGGFLTCLDRDGSVLDDDKGMWQQGRFTWLLGHLHNNVEARPEWLDLARNGIDFIRRHGFDPQDGRMWFHVTRDGHPVRKRRYNFSEAFAAIAFAEYAVATEDEDAAAEARRLFDRFMVFNTAPNDAPPKFTDVRPMKAIGFPMITIGIAQVLRDTVGHPEAEAWIDRSVEEIRRDFLKPDTEVVMETVGLNGEVLDHFDGRTLNPGHAIEGAWFILREARRRGDPELTRMGCDMLDWMWKRGWDGEYGGMLYFCDLHGGPVAEYWHDMKFWWPHNETVIATLLAYQLTGEERYARWHTLVHDWAFEHFPDPEHGEWFGYLHRDGRRSVPLKGNLFKGPFHLPRMLINGTEITGDLLAGASGFSA